METSIFIEEQRPPGENHYGGRGKYLNFEEQFDCADGPVFRTMHIRSGGAHPSDFVEIGSYEFIRDAWLGGGLKEKVFYEYAVFPQEAQVFFLGDLDGRFEQEYRAERVDGPTGFELLWKLTGILDTATGGPVVQKTLDNLPFGYGGVMVEGSLYSEEGLEDGTTMHVQASQLKKVRRSISGSYYLEAFELPICIFDLSPNHEPNYTNTPEIVGVEPGPGQCIDTESDQG